MAIDRFQPKISQRGTKGYYFFEISLALGPQDIGVTGDNRYETLYGREYLLELRDDDTLHLYREDPTDGQWTEITEDLPSQAFGSPLPGDARQVTFAFDQSARINLAYEVDGHIYVTRWDTSTNQYIQNVDFAGHDPAILMDATILDPRGYPKASEGWSVQEAYHAGGGFSIAFEWLAEDPPTWRDNPITDSDVVIFYLSTDRTGVRARVQRQQYLTENNLYDFAEPIIMDRAIALTAKYELLISDSAGDPLPNMLISETYVGDWLIIFAPTDGVDAVVSPGNLRAAQEIYPTYDDDPIAGVVEVDDLRIEEFILDTTSTEQVSGTVEPDDLTVVEEIYDETDSDALDANVEPDGPLVVVAEVVLVEPSEPLDANVAPEDLRAETQ